MIIRSDPTIVERPCRCRASRAAHVRLLAACGLLDAWRPQVIFSETVQLRPQGNKVSYTLDVMGNRVSEQVKDPAGTLVRDMRAPCSWMTMAEADRLARMAAMASQVVAS